MQVMQNIGDVLSLEETQVTMLFDQYEYVHACNRRQQGRQRIIVAKVASSDFERLNGCGIGQSENLKSW